MRVTPSGVGNTPHDGLARPSSGPLSDQPVVLPAFASDSRSGGRGRDRRPRAAAFALLVVLVLCWATAAGWLPLADPVRRTSSAALVVLAYVLFCVMVAMRRRAAAQSLRGSLRKWAASAGPGSFRSASPGQAVSGVASTDAAPILVAYASQTGFAEQLAWQTADTLQTAGMAVRVLPLGDVDAAQLATTRRVLFVVSTTGEGDAPDTAVGFSRRVMRVSVDLHGVSYGVLSLGDRSYSHYCAFGRALDAWLHRHGAQPLFDTVQVDNGNADDLRHWQQYLGVLSGNADMADWTTPAYGDWRLVDRHLLNPGSPGGPAFLVSMVAAETMPSWQAGDIAEIGPRQSPAEVDRVLLALGMLSTTPLASDGEGRWRVSQETSTSSSNDTQASRTLAEHLSTCLLPHDADALAALAGRDTDTLLAQLKPLPHREYSIASLPDDGVLQLLVRQTRYPDGRLGVGSGWLTEHAPVGSLVALRVRQNRGFHPPADDRPMILIGNGTGLAGLRAHLKARAQSGHHRNWLLFGERTAAHDQFFADELLAWQQSGVLARLDRVFSRDGSGPRHVQDRLAEVADTLREWVADGAAIYVCGSLQGMASGVAAVLQHVLGDAQLEALTDAGRYRRDVY